MTGTRSRLASAWCAVVVAACSSSGGAHEEEEVAESAQVSVTCVPARSVSEADRVEVRGTIRPPPGREVVVSPLVAGRVIELRVHEGDHVTKGQVIATIDDPALAADATEAGSASASAQAAYDNAQSALARAERLFAQGIAARREVDDARLAVASAKAALDGAHARSGLATARRARAAVTSPIAGIVLQVMRAPGDLVDGSSQTPLASIADPSVLELRADVPVPAFVRLQEDADAEVQLDALPGGALRGHVVVVGAAVDAQTGLGSVRIALDAPAEGLKIGLAGRARVRVGGDAQAIVVPQSALRRSPTGQDELVVCSRGEGGALLAEVRSVEVGERRGDEVVVREGIAAGEPVVVDHALGLEAGARLRAAAPSVEPAHATQRGTTR